MSGGTSQGLFVVVAIVIFGIFVVLANTLFGSEGLTNDLKGLFENATEQAEKNLENKKPTLLIEDNKEYFTASIPRAEYVQTDIDFSTLADEYGEGKYTLVFDLKASKEGSVKVYTIDYQTQEYAWNKVTVDASPEYKTFKLDIDVFKSKDERNKDEVDSMLSFMGGENYESSILPTIKNIKVYKVLD